MAVRRWEHRPGPVDGKPLVGAILRHITPLNLGIS